MSKVKKKASSSSSSSSTTMKSLPIPMGWAAAAAAPAKDPTKLHANTLIQESLHQSMQDSPQEDDSLPPPPLAKKTRYSIDELDKKRSSIIMTDDANDTTIASTHQSSSLDKIRKAIQSAKNFSSRVKFTELNLDTVLSSTSYRNLMKQTFGCDTTTSATTHIPTIARAFEESYMREPLPTEKECARGMRCECRFIDPENPFTAVEFLTLEEMANPPEENQLCVICSRKETQFLYYDMVYNHVVYNSVIQRYGNMSGQNEYASECLLRCNKSSDLSCMPKAIMSHQRNRYLVYRHPELKILCLKQIRVSPSDYATEITNHTQATQQQQCMTLANKIAGGKKCRWIKFL
jgi:hypothetical protein